MIPEAAVEAAVQRSWHLEITTSDVREILEAAAPHMLAEAWDEGADFVNEGTHSFASDNPYRPAP